MSCATADNTQGDAPARPLRGEVPGLTGLRFIAALSVAMAHGSELILKFDAPSLQLTYWLSQLAGLGMGLFFVLSGFVIHYNYRITVTQGGLEGLGGFLWARFSRLYPLYFLIIVLDVLLGRKLYEFMAGNDDAFTDVLHALPYYLTFTQSWLYVPFPDNSLIYVTGINSSLTWSISTEWFFYVSYPFVALFVIRARRPLVTIVAALAWCVVWIILVTILFDRAPQIDAWAVSHYGPIAGTENGIQDSYFRWLMYFSPYLRIGEFILGCIIAQLFIQLECKSISDRERLVGRLILAVGILSVPVLTYMMYSPYGYVLSVRRLNLNFGLAPSVALIIFCVARYDTIFTRTLNSRAFEALGNASYSIYLIHFLVFVVAASFLGASLPATAPNIVYLAGKYLFLLTLIMVISLGLHAYIEVPARQWLRGLWRQGPGLRRRAIAYSIFASPGIIALLMFLAIASAATDLPVSFASGIRVTSATYGGNCQARMGNVTRPLGKACDGKDSCSYIVDARVLGDPAPGCAKSFSVHYQCAPDVKQLTQDLPGEAGFKSQLLLSCAPAGAGHAEASAPAVTPVPSNADARSAGEDTTPRSDATPSGEIQVRSATYGGNCGARSGNATSDVQMTCDGERNCTYTIDVNRFGDPAPSCGKDFAVEYQCAPSGPLLHASVPGEAGFGRSTELTCGSIPARVPLSAAKWTGIRVLSATYGGNCGAKIGNVTDNIGQDCDTKTSCAYTVQVQKLGDPAPKCAKSFFVKYQCGDESIARSAALPGEAGLGSVIRLTCP
jgi:peptidoglycan/LPS O-acetylase OafA/YrhL